jgi:hypothetical protein
VPVPASEDSGMYEDNFGFWFWFFKVFFGFFFTGAYAYV